MENSKGKKIWNTIFWLVIVVLIMIALYILYNKLRPAKLELMPPQQGVEKTTGDNREKEQSNNEQAVTQDNAGSGNSNKNGAEENGDESGEGEENKNDEEKNGEGDEDKSQKIMAPDFTLEDLDGNEVNLSDYRGKIVFLNFWATWCIYCVQEMPDLESANKKLAEAGDAVIVTVNQMEDKDTVRKFMEDKKLTLPVLMDYTGEVNYMYGVSGIPVTYVIDKDGSVYGRIVGRTDEETILMVAEELGSAND